MISSHPQGRLLSELSIESLEAEAVEFLRDKCGQSARVGLGFSGGKDSVVIMELMRRAGVEFTAFYHATQIDPPEVVRFIRKHYPEVVFFYAEKKFFRKIITFAPPLPNARWCCGILKRGGKKTRKFNPLVLGIRAEESARRKDYSRVDPWRKKQTTIYPILSWRLCDVWEYIEYRNLPYCSLYDEGFDRLGCVPCPFKSPKIHEISKLRWPGIYRAFENSVKKWFFKKWWENHTMAADSPEEFCSDYYKHKARWYSNEPRHHSWREKELKQMARVMEAEK